MILSERHVQLPVDLVLDRPAARHPLRESLGRELLAQNMVPNVSVVLTIPCRVADHHADGVEARPTFPARKCFRRLADAAPTRLLHAVHLPLFMAHSNRRIRRLVIEEYSEHLLDPIPQRPLVFFDVEDVGATMINDVLGHSRLADHGIDGPDCSLENWQCQQFLDGHDFVALRVRGNLAEANRVRRRPGTDYVNHRLTTCLVEVASQGLPVDCDLLTAGHLVKGRDTPQQASLKLRGLYRSKDRIEPVMRRNAFPEINDLAKRRSAV